MKRTSLTGLIAGIALTAFGGFIVVDSTSDIQDNPNQKTIKTKAESVKTEISFVTGELNIDHALSNDFFKGNFDYEKEKWKPEVSFTSEGKQGKLSIISTDGSGDRDYDDSDQSHWNLVFDQNTENDIDIDLFAAEGNINLADCNIKSFDLNMKAGDIGLNLHNTSIRHLYLSAIAGEADVDLTGKWKNDLNAKIVGGVGELHMTLPADIGVKMEISGLLGDITTPGFEKNGHFYTNSLYGKTDYTLYLDIFGGIGDINIVME